MQPEQIIHSTVSDVLDHMPPTGFVRTLFWEGKDGSKKSIILVSGDSACELALEAVGFITDDPLEGPSSEELVLDKRGNMRKTMEALRKRLETPPEQEDQELILSCLKETLDTRGDQIQLSEIAETLAASLSVKSNRSFAYVIAAILKLAESSGQDLNRIADYLAMDDAATRIVGKLSQRNGNPWPL